MAFTVNYEEYVPLSDFLMVSFSRDQRDIEVKFPKLDAGYLEAFQVKIDRVKQLEGTLRLTEEQKEVTRSLYAEADALNGNLNFLSTYMKDAGLSTVEVSEVKEHLNDADIEAAVLGLRDLKTYIASHEAALVENGMAPDFLTSLDETIVSLEAKNALQNTVMNARKELVSANLAEYKSLYAYVSNVAAKGKLVFKGTVKEDEYVISKIIKRMRAPERRDEE